MNTPSGRRVYHIQTTEKIPTRVILRARGTAGHASLPLPDNPVVALARALVKLAETDQPVELNDTTRNYFGAMARLEAYRWLAPLLPRLNRRQTAIAAANEIRARDAELDAQLRASVSPTMLAAGLKINVIPNTAEAQIDVRRLPTETGAEVIARLRRLVNDTAVEVLAAPGQEMPHAAPSPLDSPLYKRMHEVFLKASPNALVCRLCSAVRPTARFCARAAYPSMAFRCSCAKTAKTARTAMTSASRWRTWPPAPRCCAKSCSPWRSR